MASEHRRRRPKPETRRLSGARRRLAQVTRGEVIAAVAAILLFVFMFFDWYGYRQAGSLLMYTALVGFGQDAWSNLELIRWVLLATIVVALAAPLLRVGGSKWKPAIPLGAATAVLGGLATLLIAYRIVDLPPFDLYDGLEVRFVVELGAYLALAAAAAITYGGYRAMGERGTSFAKVADGLASERRRPPRKAAPKRPPRREPRASQKQSPSSSD